LLAWGVDAVISNRPDHAAALVRRWAVVDGDDTA
jgi:hypothetical protein